MEISSGVAGLLGALIGALAGIITTYINVSSSAKVQMDLENLKRDNEIKDLQRDTLLNLQNNLNDFLKLHTSEVIENKVLYENNINNWSYKINSINDDEIQELNKLISLQVVRLKNEKLRSEIKKFQGKMNSLHLKNNFKELFSVFIDLAKNDYTNMINSLGEELRKTY